MAGIVKIVINATSNLSKVALSVGESFNKMAKAGLKAAASTTKWLAGLAVGFGKLAFDANGFNKQLAQISTLTEIPFATLKKQVREVSAEFGMSKEALTKGLYDALSAGVPADNVFDFLRTASKAAVAGAGTTAESVKLLTGVMNAYGLKAEDAGRISDVMFMTIKRGVTTMPELAESLGDVGSLANAMGISIEEVAGAVTTLTKKTGNTSKATTQLRGALVAMNEILGDGWHNAMTLQQGLVAVREAAGGSQVKLKELVGRMEGVLGILATTGDNAAGAAEDFDKAANSIGETNAAFDKMSDAQKLDRILQRLNNIMLTMGDKTLKLLTGEINNTLDALDLFEQSGALEKMAEDVASLAVAAKNALGGIKAVIGALSDAAQVAGSMSAGMSFSESIDALIDADKLKESDKMLRAMQKIQDDIIKAEEAYIKRQEELAYGPQKRAREAAEKEFEMLAGVYDRARERVGKSIADLGKEISKVSEERADITDGQGWGDNLVSNDVLTRLANLRKSIKETEKTALELQELKGLEGVKTAGPMKPEERTRLAELRNKYEGDLGGLIDANTKKLRGMEYTEKSLVEEGKNAIEIDKKVNDLLKERGEKVKEIAEEKELNVKTEKLEADLVEIEQKLNELENWKVVIPVLMEAEFKGEKEAQKEAEKAAKENQKFQAKIAKLRERADGGGRLTKKGREMLNFDNARIAREANVLQLQKDQLATQKELKALQDKQAKSLDNIDKKIQTVLQAA